jgi:hypothetical protein
LRIRHFFGTSENAVKTQIWTAVCFYVLAAIIKKGTGARYVALYFPTDFIRPLFRENPAFPRLSRR